MLHGLLTGQQLAVCAVVAFGSMSYGYGLAGTSTSLGQPSFITYMELDTAANATALTSAIGIAFYVGGFIGACLLPFVADRFGRKMNLYFYSVMLIIFGGLQAGSVNANMFIAMRILVGVAAGALFVTVPLYQSEVAPAHLRGALLACHGTLFCSGTTLCSWINVGFSFYSGNPNAWRPTLAFICLPPLILLVALHWVPESPRFLVSRGRNEEALAILNQLHAGTDGTSQDFVAAEFAAILAAEEHEKENSAGWSDLLATPANRKRSMLACFIMWGYPWTGINVIASYVANLMANMGMDSTQQLLLLAGLNTYAPIGNLISAFIVDSVGRKRMILTALIGCTCALVIQTTVVLKGENSKVGQGFGIFSIWLFFVSFTTFYDVASFCISTEIWPQHLRAKGFSMALACYFAANVLTVGVAPTGLASIGGYFFIVFIAWMAGSFVIVQFWYPETSGLSLEDMARVFDEGLDNEVTAIHINGSETGQMDSKSFDA